VAGIHWLGHCSRSSQRHGLCRNKALLSPSSVGLCSADRNVTHRGSNVAARASYLDPIIGAALATLVAWLMRKWAPGLHFEEYVEAVRLKNGRIPLLSMVWRTASSAFSVATGAAIGREGSMIQFATAISSWVGERSPSTESGVVASGSPRLACDPVAVPFSRRSCHES
jgi:H+/Cl- antiporter ClcA